jgi:hypothetical protein
MNCSTELSCPYYRTEMQLEHNKVSAFRSAVRLWSVMIAAVLCICVLIVGLAAQAGDWVTDAKSGCQIWNPSPQLEESVTWSGSCVQGHAEGKGVVQWLKSAVPFETDEGEWHSGRQAGNGKQSWPNGRYEGELTEGEPNGRGVLTIQNLRYEGEFRNGKPNGLGTLRVGNESVSGDWKDGCLQGSRKASIGVPLSACR